MRWRLPPGWLLVSAWGRWGVRGRLGGAEDDEAV
jgi:hypothetical protein